MMRKLVYRTLGAVGSRYPEWLRDLMGASGAYVIKNGGGDVVYVGESHSGKLYGTITRHFQSWGRRKTFWQSLFGGGGSDADPGRTYDRGSCSVAVIKTRPARAIAAQYALIRKLRPRDNQVRGDGGEDAPF